MPAVPATAPRARAGAEGGSTRGSAAGQAPAGDWLIAAGALVLFGSLFLTWSHQFSTDVLTQFGSASILQGVPRNPTAWQVYSAADVVLALLAAGLLATAVFGVKAARQVAAAAAAIALVFVVHALSVPPTTGTVIFNPALAVPDYIPNSPGAGPGETLAVVGLLMALGGLALTFVADRRAPATHT